jgi:hypothetical protein
MTNRHQCHRWCDAHLIRYRHLRHAGRAWPEPMRTTKMKMMMMMVMKWRMRASVGVVHVRQELRQSGGAHPSTTIEQKGQDVRDATFGHTMKLLAMNDHD